jgi:hypothetical protein
MRIRVAVEAVDFRKAIDGLARVCQEKLQSDDGRGFWLCQRRLSRGRFAFWPARKSLERDVVELLRRSVGRPSYKPLVWYRSFLYQAASWKTARRVVAKVEHHPGELFPRVGFIVTNLTLPSRRVYIFNRRRAKKEIPACTLRRDRSMSESALRGNSWNSLSRKESESTKRKKRKSWQKRRGREFLPTPDQSAQNSCVKADQPGS